MHQPKVATSVLAVMVVLSLLAVSIHAYPSWRYAAVPRLLHHLDISKSLSILYILIAFNLLLLI